MTKERFAKILLVMRSSIIQKIVFFAAIVLLVSACSPDKKAAQEMLTQARELYKNGEYTKSKQTIDSMKMLYPKAFDQINAGFALTDSIRKGENTLIIAQCDSLITTYTPVIDSMKQYFIYQRNKEYQETGFFIPKEGYTGEKLTNTTLRSGVDEKNGQIYLESVYIGGQIHNQIKVSTKDEAFAESLPVTSEGLNFRFSNLGKQFEVIKFAGKDDNGVSKFIVTHIDKPVTVTISGQGNITYTLSANAKSAINKAYDLSVMMTQLDSLKTEKGKAQYKLHYLDNKGKEQPVIE